MSGASGRRNADSSTCTGRAPSGASVRVAARYGRISASSRSASSVSSAGSTSSPYELNSAERRHGSASSSSCRRYARASRNSSSSWTDASAWTADRTAGVSSVGSSRKPVAAARHGRSRPSVASPARSTKPCFASCRRCQLQLDGGRVHRGRALARRPRADREQVRQQRGAQRVRERGQPADVGDLAPVLGSGHRRHLPERVLSHLTTIGRRCEGLLSDHRSEA